MMKNKIIKEYVFTVIIFLIISLPFFGMMFKEDKVDFEKSSSMSFKEIIEKGFLREDIFADFDKWFKANFFLRKDIIKAHSKINTNYFGVSPTYKVILGKDNWLFFKFQETLECYMNTNLISDDECKEYVKFFDSLNKSFREKDIKFYFLSIPNKSNVYSEYMPDNILKKNSISRLDQINKILDKNYHIDLKEFLIKNKSRGRLYYKKDTHWNSLGAFLSFEYFFNNYLFKDFYSINKKIENIDFKEEYKMYKGDLDIMLGNTASKRTLTYDIDFPIKKYEVDSFNNEKRILTKIDSGIPLKIIVYRDSFSAALIPFFSSTFAEVEYVHDFKIDFNYILKNDYDIVIIESVERFMDDVLKDNT